MTRVLIVLVLILGASCSSNGSDEEAVSTPSTADSSTSTTSTSDPLCSELVGKVVDRATSSCLVPAGDTFIVYGFTSVTCETGPDLAFMGGNHDPIVLTGHVGGEWRTFEGSADFPETSGTPYRACRPSEPPCEPTAEPGTNGACPGG